MSDDNKRPVDIIVDGDERFRALYSDGSLGLALTIDETMDTLPLLAEAAPEET